ncbi:MAG: glycosyltransferase [Ignisphaera sp.]
MRIGLIRREFITHLDGVNRFIANLAEAFKLLEHEVFILSWSYRGVVEDLGKWFKIVHGLDVEIEVATLRGPEDKDMWLTMLFDWFTKGSEMLERFNADIAIVNGVVPIRFKPKIAVAHGPLVSVSRLQRSVLKLLYRTYDRVICISEETQREYKGIVKCDGIIPLPLKLKNFKPLEPSKRANLIVHLGTRPVKNPLVSARVVEILRARGHDIELVIISGRSEWLERGPHQRSSLGCYQVSPRRKRIKFSVVRKRWFYHHREKPSPMLASKLWRAVHLPWFPTLYLGRLLSMDTMVSE